MKITVSYKAESTGYFKAKEPSDSESQPHLVRLSAVKTLDGEIVEEFDKLIRPLGWEIPEKTIAFHGITNGQAILLGLPEKEVIESFLEFCEGSTLITPSKYFNKRMIRITTKRYCDISVSDSWRDNEDHHCVISQAKKQMGMKKLTLEEAAKTYEFDYEKGDSLLDAKTTAKIYSLINKS